MELTRTSLSDQVGVSHGSRQPSLRIQVILKVCYLQKWIPRGLVSYPEWHESMVNANTDVFEMSYEESVSYFKHLENLEKIRRTNSPNPSSLPVDEKKSVTSSVGKSSKNYKGSNM
jgi:gamma-glutamyltranspeptidase